MLLADHGHYYPIFGLFFHGADIFVAYSGLVCGMVYSRTIQRDGRAESVRKGIVRAAQLFVYNACACILVLLIVAGFDAAGIRATPHGLDKPVAQAALGTILLYEPIEYFNILNYYILMLLVLPFFVMGQMQTRWPIFASATIYLAYTAWQLGTGQVGSVGTFFVSPLAWQFLFFGGVTVGMHYDRVRAILPSLNRTIGPIMLYLLMTHFLREQDWIVHRFAQKYDLGFLRIVDLVLVSYVIDRLVRPDVKIDARSLQVIASLGSNSLFVFAMSLVLCYAASNLLVVFDGSRAFYLGVILTEIAMMMWLGRLLMCHSGLRSLTQLGWLDRATRPLTASRRGDELASG